MTTRYKSALMILGVILGAALGCGLGCFVVMKWTSPDDMHAQDHEWLHDHLELSHDQEEPMEIIEEKFAEIQALHRQAIRDANRELAEAFLEDQSFSPRVKDAVDSIHQAQAALQKATIEHLVDMKSVLTEEQYALVLKLTEASLTGQ